MFPPDLIAAGGLLFAFDHATMNFGEFEIRIDFDIDGDKIVFATEKVEEGTKVSVHLD